MESHDRVLDLQAVLGGKIELKNGQKILLAKGDGARLAVVQMVEV